MFEGDKQIEDFLQSENDFSIPTPGLSHKEYCFGEKQIPKIELPSTADINQFENIFKVELSNNLDQRDLQVLQCKDDTLPRGLAPLEELFDFNDVAKKPKIESAETDVEIGRAHV